MMLFSTLLTLIAVLGALAFTFWSIRRTLRSFASLVMFNAQGGGLFVRMVPNLAYTILFFMLIRLCWF